MKKAAVVIAAAILLMSVVGCGDNGIDNGTESTADESNSVSTDGETEKAEENFDYKLGLGVISNAGESIKGNVLVVNTAAAVVMTADGTIVKCYIDCIENSVPVMNGVITDDVMNTDFSSKREMGDAYNMKPMSAIGKEWYEQADAFEAYVIGMTADEVLGIKTGETDKSGKHRAEDETLYAGCTIDIRDFVKAVHSAASDERAKGFNAENTDEINIGLHLKSYFDKSTRSYSEDMESGSVAVYTDIGAVATDKEGALYAAINDIAEPSVSFDAEGNIIAGNSDIVRTKRMLGDEYGMKKYSPIGREWYEQAEYFCEFIKGKNGVEVNSLGTKLSDGKMIAADDTLYAGCTVAIDGFKDIISRAIDNAR